MAELNICFVIPPQSASREPVPYATPPCLTSLPHLVVTTARSRLGVLYQCKKKLLSQSLKIPRLIAS